MTESDALRPADPPSLERRAPERLSLADDAGRPPALGRAGYLLVAGRRYTLAVRPRPGDAVTFAVGEGLREVVPSHRVDTDDGPEWRVTFRRARLVRPVPLRADVHVNLQRAGLPTFSQVVPVLLWPSWKSRLAWVAGVAGGTFLLPNLPELWAGRDRLPAALSEAVADPWNWLIAAATLVGVPALMQAAGWGWLTIGDADE